MSDEVTNDDLYRLSVEGTYREFVLAARKKFGAKVENYTEEQYKKLLAKWRDWPSNPYSKNKPKVVVLKTYRVTFSRIGSDPDYRGFTTFVKAPELGATVAPIKKIVNDIFEDEYEIPQANLQVTLVDDKGQINFGLLGEFTVVEMPS